MALSSLKLIIKSKKQYYDYEYDINFLFNFNITWISYNGIVLSIFFSKFNLT